MAEIKVDGLEEIIASLGEVEERSRDLTPVMAVLAEDMKTLIDDAFEAEAGPDGKLWQPLKASTLARRRGTSAKILTDTGVLRNSINARASATAIRFGTNVPYAGAHQFGVSERNLVARPFFPIRESGGKFVPQRDGLDAREFYDRALRMIADYIETGEIIE